MPDKQERSKHVPIDLETPRSPQRYRISRCASAPSDKPSQDEEYLPRSSDRRSNRATLHAFSDGFPRHMWRKKYRDGLERTSQDRVLPIGELL